MPLRTVQEDPIPGRGEGVKVFITNHPDHEDRYLDAALDLSTRFDIEAARWIEQPEGERQTLHYLMLEGLVGEGPWLVMRDTARFTIAPYRVGSMGDVHFYGGWSGHSPLDSLTQPVAFLLLNNDVRRQLAMAWADKDLTAAEGWANVITGNELTWDTPPTVKEVTHG